MRPSLHGTNAGGPDESDIKRGAVSSGAALTVCPSVAHTTAGTCSQLPALTTMAPVDYSFAEACATLRISAHTSRPRIQGGKVQA
jgi:hypothetical protein